MSKMRNKTLATALLLLAALANSAELPENGVSKHAGVATCAASQCHGSTIPRDATGVLQNEYVTWTQADPHAAAYATLGNEQSQGTPEVKAVISTGATRSWPARMTISLDQVWPSNSTRCR